jgi:hypothetical protein
MCGDDALRGEVESLLAHDGSAAFLSTPAAVQAGHVMARFAEAFEILETPPTQD